MLSYSQGEAQEKLFQYNLNGELTQIAQGSEYTSFTPDALGRIKAVTLPDYSTLSYSLDHSGRRVQKLKNGSKVYRNIYEDEFKIAAEVGPLGQFKEYVYATNINSADYIKDGSKHYKILKDHLGSPRLVVNASTGAIVQRMNYNEWRMVTLDTNPGFQSFGFAGGIYDQDTKLVKFGARDYDGSTGRWLSKDPIGFTGGDTNLYGYVLQEPVNFVDPKGTVSQASATVCLAALAIGEGYDIVNNIRKAIKQQEDVENKLNELDEEKKTCTSTRKLEILKEQGDILKAYQSNSLMNIADVLTPGNGVKVGVGACLVFLSTF